MAENEKYVTENSIIKNTIRITDKEAQYDKAAKEILGNKSILSYLLVNVVEEFYGMDPQEAVAYIEGDPYVGIVPVEPGMTNAGDKIVGMNTESSEKNEGVIYFDILFFVRTRNGKSKIIVDVEIQKDEPTTYHILNRAIFYVSRQISAQKGREFVKSQFNNIKQVYSIWVCLNQKEDTQQHIHFTKDEQQGKRKWKGRMEIPNIVMIGLAKNLSKPKKANSLHRLLGTLFSDKMYADEKIEILENEYHICMEEKMKEGLNHMCNLGQGIREKGERIGEQRGEQRGMRLIEKLMTLGRIDDCHRAMEDIVYRRQLMRELNIR